MHEKSIELLNQAMAEELAAIHQYMYFHFHCDDQGYDPLAALFKQTAIEEMIHAEKLAERILFLGGEVEMKLAGELGSLLKIEESIAKAVKKAEDAHRQGSLFASELEGKVVWPLRPAKSKALDKPKSATLAVDGSPSAER